MKNQYKNQCCSVTEHEHFKWLYILLNTSIKWNKSFQPIEITKTDMSELHKITLNDTNLFNTFERKNSFLKFLTKRKTNFLKNSDLEQIK